MFFDPCVGKSCYFYTPQTFFCAPRNLKSVTIENTALHYKHFWFQQGPLNKVVLLKIQYFSEFWSTLYFFFFFEKWTKIFHLLLIPAKKWPHLEPNVFTVLQCLKESDQIASIHTRMHRHTRNHTRIKWKIEECLQNTSLGLCVSYSSYL